MIYVDGHVVIILPLRCYFSNKRHCYAIHHTDSAENHRFVICVLTCFTQMIRIAFLQMVIKIFNSAGYHSLTLATVWWLFRTKRGPLFSERSRTIYRCLRGSCPCRPGNAGLGGAGRAPCSSKGPGAWAPALHCSKGKHLVPALWKMSFSKVGCPPIRRAGLVFLRPPRGPAGLWACECYDPWPLRARASVIIGPGVFCGTRTRASFFPRKYLGIQQRNFFFLPFA